MTVIKQLKKTFAKFDIPQIVVSDNRPAPKTIDFKVFAKEWDLKYIKARSNYLQANGMVK